MSGKNIFRKIVVVLVIGIIMKVPVYAQTNDLYINEFLASNLSSNLSRIYNEYADWLEIYNAGTTTVNLKGYFLTDNADDSAKWDIPFDTLLAPGAYMLFWADGNDNYIHTNFKIRRNGEFLGLYDPSGQVIDSLSFGQQENDISYGRLLDDIESWAFYDSITPGMPNNTPYYYGKSLTPQFSINGGFYSGSQQVSIYSPNTNAVFYYTIDGSPPNRSSMIYTSPIQIDTTTALRIRAYDDGMLPSDVTTQTYFIDEDVNLTIVSIVTDPINLFDDSVGIYVIGTNGKPGYCSDVAHNLNMDWERPVNVELYNTDGDVLINQRAGVKIYGGCSRTRYPQKSLALYARGEYGKGSFDCQLFKEKPIYSFESFILRNSADDCRYTMFKDAMGQSIIIGKTDIDWQAYRPAVVYINGQYWGIQNIREKLNEHYVVENYGIDSDEVNLVRGSPHWGLMHGSSDDYIEMIDYIENQNLENQDVYNYAKARIDINNYIDYQIAEIYLSANDWPMNNLKYWRANSGKYDKWRWIIYDLDNCFFYIDRNTMELASDPWCNCTWPNPPWSTLLFRKLLENEEFRNDFIQRYAWHMSTTFQPARVNHIIDSMKLNIEPEIPRHIVRWGGQIVPFPEQWIKPTFNSMEEWYENIDRMKRFVDSRMEPAQKHIMDYFHLPQSMAGLTIRSANPEAGIIKMNHQTISGDFYRGNYFRNVPLKVKAFSFTGYKFSHWEYSSVSQGNRIDTSPVLNLDMTEDVSLVAHFEIADENDRLIIINEINYRSSDEFNSGDWVELYNLQNGPIDLSGWTFKDSNDDHVFTFPKGQEIEPYGYLVLCEDITSFKQFYPKILNSIGDTGFGFSNGGEELRLFTPNGKLMDAVMYDDEAPWPEEANGTGATLELRKTNLDNNLAENWIVQAGHGTPGKQNLSNTIKNHQLEQNYPNPVNSSAMIPYSLVEPGHVVIKVFDSTGRIITAIQIEQQEAAAYEMIFNAGKLNNGVYFYTMTVDGEFIDTKRMVIIR